MSLRSLRSGSSRSGGERVREMTGLPASWGRTVRPGEDATPISPSPDLKELPASGLLSHYPPAVHTLERPLVLAAHSSAGCAESLPIRQERYAAPSPSGPGGACSPGGRWAAALGGVNPWGSGRPR